MTRRTMTAVALTLMLSGCGDDGNGTKISSTASSSTGAAAPAPSPTPSPSPSPSPSPTAATYDKAANLNSDHTFTGYDRFSATIKDDTVTAWEASSSDSAVTSYRKSEGKITFADSADLPNGGVFSAPGISAGTQLSIRSSDASIKLGIPSKLGSYQYFIFADYKDASKYRNFIIGAPTASSELNKAVTLTYLGMIAEEGNTAGVKPGTLTVDLAKSTISGTVPLIHDEGKSMDMTLTGTIDAAKHIKGTLQGADGKTTGEFRGRPFGPGGKELALIVTLKWEGDATIPTVLTASLK